jgi:hypothetical protein
MFTGEGQEADLVSCLLYENITNSILYSSSQIESLRRYLFACWPAAERSVFVKSQSQTERHQWLRLLLLSSWNGLSPSSPLDHTCKNEWACRLHIGTTH